MTALSPEALMEHLNWRYAVKKFDQSKKISDSVWNTLESALVLAPSSYGLQPWKFIVVKDQAIKEKLRAVSWNQEQITSCSHLVVFTIQKNLGAAQINHFIERIAEVRGVSAESLAGYRDAMLGGIVDGPIKPIVDQWAARQLYIALGMFLSSAALMEIDTCPMEGFENAKYDEILGLDKKGLSALVLCPAGYRAADDKYSGAPKVRFPKEEVIEHR